MSIPLSRPYFTDNSRKNILSGIDEVLKSGQLMMGKWTSKFESSFKICTNTDYALTVSTCTTALQISLNYFDIKDREVLVPSASFLTDISAIRWCGGIPVLVDINPDTLSFDLEDLKNKLSDKTKGILWVHLTGIISPQYKEIIDFADNNNLFLLEDCAHAHGSSIDGLPAGSLGDAGCFSFFPSKIMTTGTGGMLVTNDVNLARYTKEVRLLGRCDDDSGEICIEGNDWFMDEIRTCIGYYQLKDLDFNITRRREIASSYSKAFSKLSKVKTIPVHLKNKPSYYQYTIILDDSISRDEIREILKNKYGISSKRIYKPTHQEEIFKEVKFDLNTLRKTEEVLNQSLCLPIYAEMSNKDVNNVIKAITSELA